MVFDQAQVASLAESYTAAGLGSTWSGSFLSSVATGGRPRGRGIALLEDLIKKGVPESWPNWALITEIRQTLPKCLRKDEAGALQRFLRILEEGKELNTWQAAYARKVIDGAERPLQVVQIDDDFRALVLGLEDRVKNQSPFYWERRGNLRYRLNSIFSRFLKNEALEVDDVKLLRDSFKGVFATWESIPKKYPPGTLVRYLGECAIIFGNRNMSGYGEIYIKIIHEEKVKNVPVSSIGLFRKSKGD